MPGREKGLPRHTPHRVPVRTVVVVGWVDVAAIEVQVVRVGTIVHGRGPVVAVAALIVQRTIVVIEVASVGKLARSINSPGVLKHLQNPKFPLGKID